MSEIKQYISHHLMRHNDPFRSACRYETIKWLYTCPDCKSIKCVYCAGYIIQCKKCLVYRCHTCATIHLNNQSCVQIIL